MTLIYLFCFAFLLLLSLYFYASCATLRQRFYCVVASVFREAHRVTLE